MQSRKQVKTSLSTSVIKGTSWLFLFQILDNVIGIIRLIIIAKLLSPNDFGLIGIATLLLQVLNTFSQTGIQQFIVHKKDYEKYLNVGWTYLILRGIVLYTILFFAAPYISTFFNNPDATTIIRYIGIGMVFDGMSSIGLVMFQKDMKFHKQFMYQFAGNFSDFLVALIAALIFQNVWALVAGMLANSFIRLIMSYVLSDYKTKLDFRFSRLKEANNYGKWIFGSNILVFLFTQGDDIIVGRLLGSTALGFYQLAYRISNLPTTQITYILSTVMFPVYAKLQNNVQKLRDIYIKNLQLTTFLSFFVGTLIIIFARDFTLLFLGSKWLPMVLSMQILTIWGVVRSIGATTGPLWQAIGTPKIATKLQLIQVIILALVILPLTYRWGFTGTSIAVVASIIIPNILAVYLMSKTIQTSFFTLLKELLYPLTASIFVYIIEHIAKNFLIHPSTIPSFIILAIISSFSYILITIIMSKYLTYDVYKNLFELVIPKLKKHQHALVKIESYIT